MKKLWTILSVLAVANLLAIGALVGWLGSSGRLTPDRVEQIRTVLSQPVEEEQEAPDEIELIEADEIAQAEAQGVPLTAEQLVEMKLQASETDRARVKRLREEIDYLQKTLDRERAALDAERESIARERAAYEDEREKIAQIEGGKNFRKALSVLEGMKAPIAKAALEAMLRGGGDVIPDGDGVGEPDGMSRVIAYLNAMQDRTRTKIVTEFAKESPDLAAELLERLRTRGLYARADEPPKQ